MASGALVLLLIFLPYLSSDIELAKEAPEISKTSKLSKEFSLTINNSVFHGISKDNLPYKIMAKAVTKQNNNIYNLNFINADYKVTNGDLEILADAGMLDEATKTFILSKNVHITFEGLLLTCEQINFDLQSNSAASQSSVVVNFKNSQITANSFNANDADNIINFEGDVSSIFDKDITSTTSDINITSESLSLDNANFFANFRGSVKVLFEEIILNTDSLKVYYAQNNGKKSITRIEIPGKLKAVKTCSGETITADKGEYIAASNELILSGNVVMNKDENIVITDKMIYVTKLKSRAKED